MNYTVQQAILKFKDEYLERYNPSSEQLKTLNNISKCRTEEMGTRIYECQNCGELVFAYNSCKDRHCPNCQNYKKEVWIDKHQQEIINAPYFHVVMTSPNELHPIFYHNKAEMYKLMFKAASDTIKELCEDKKYLGCKVGLLAVLHTWNQTMDYHPHIHMIVTGGGINSNGEFVYSKEDYLLPVKVISRVFRGKFLAYINASDKLEFYGKYLYLNDKRNLNNYLRPLYEKEWVCYCKEPFKNVAETYNYLSRYTYKVCISDERIEDIDDKYVTIKYRDRKDSSKTKFMKLEGVEFVRRLLMHVLPKSFMKVRSYGLLAGKNRKKNIVELKKKTNTADRKYKIRTKIEILNQIVGRDITKCVHCGGELILKETKMPHAPPVPLHRGEYFG